MTRYTLAVLAIASAILAASGPVTAQTAGKSSTQSSPPADTQGSSRSTPIERERAKSSDPAGDYASQPAWAAHALAGRGSCR